MMTLEYNMLFAYTVGIIVLFLMGRILIKPIKLLLKLVMNSVIGIVVLLGINFIGKFLDFHIALNAFTALVTGILGVPGIALIIIVKRMLSL